MLASVAVTGALLNFCLFYCCRSSGTRNKKMGRAPCCSKVGLRRGPWSVQEDNLLINYIQAHGEGRWRNLPKKAGLLRCGKSCRLRWLNYLRPDIKRGNISSDEDDLIIRLHSLLGNRWSLIAKRLPGRTDNEIKNHWNSHLSKQFETDGGTEPRVLKKRSKSTRGKKLKNHNQDCANEMTTETKIYLPKAVRVSSHSTSRIWNFDCYSMASGSSSSVHEEGNIINLNDAEVNIQPDLIAQTNNTEHQLGAARKEEYGFHNTSDILFIDSDPIGDYKLDEILAEYRQLLNLEDDVQSDSSLANAFAAWLI